MNAFHALTLSALSLAMFTVGCGAEPDGANVDHSSAVTSNTGYGYEFEDDDLLAPKDTTAAASPSGAIKDGRLAPEAIRDAVRAHAGEIKACHDAAQKRDPAVSGKVTVHFVIRPDGSVEGPKDNGSTVKDEAMLQCMTGAFGGMKFPTSTGGPITVVYPLVFARCARSS